MKEIVGTTPFWRNFSDSASEFVVAQVFSVLLLLVWQYEGHLARKKSSFQQL